MLCEAWMSRSVGNLPRKEDVSGGFRPRQRLGGAAGSVGARGAAGLVQDPAGGTILAVSAGADPRLKKVDSSPRPASKTIPTPRSSPIVAEPISSSLPPSVADLPRESPSPSLPEKRPSGGTVTQGKEKRARAASELSDPPKGGIPHPSFPSCDPLMTAGFFTTSSSLLLIYYRGVNTCAKDYKQSSEFEATLSASVDSFKKSPEFVDALGANVAYGAYSFVRNYKEKYPGLCSDYKEFQEDYNSSWFADLNLDAPSEDEEDKEAAPSSSDAAPKA
ncbi:hypothetical protein LIER_16092 [Lithospermum erythrorhizon]|uniref:Uncharacterized protein n=1 Tax=Lithospermum erythrorhizon TaxID=34254 RepID=A0AAV3Q5A8_LITER